MFVRSHHLHRSHWVTLPLNYLEWLKTHGLKWAKAQDRRPSLNNGLIIHKAKALTMKQISLMSFWPGPKLSSNLKILVFLIKTTSFTSKSLDCDLTEAQGWPKPNSMSSSLTRARKSWPRSSSTKLWMAYLDGIEPTGQVAISIFFVIHCDHNALHSVDILSRSVMMGKGQKSPASIESYLQVRAKSGSS